MKAKQGRFAHVLGSFRFFMVVVSNFGFVLLRQGYGGFPFGQFLGLNWVCFLGEPLIFDWKHNILGLFCIRLRSL
jgi:hypothetical protein